MGLSMVIRAAALPWSLGLAFPSRLSKTEHLRPYTQPSRGLPPTNLRPFSRSLQLPIPLCQDLRLTPGEHVLRRDGCRLYRRPETRDHRAGQVRARAHEEA